MHADGIRAGPFAAPAAHDAAIVAGQQKTALIGLVWAPIDYIRITANYGKVWVDDARVAAANGDRSYSADTFGLRTQVDF